MELFKNFIKPLNYSRSITLVVILASQIGWSQYDSLARVHYQTYDLIHENYKVGLINKITGDTLLPPEYNYVEAFSEGLARVRGYSGTIGYIDTTGKFIIPLGKFDSPRGGADIGRFSNGLAIVMKGNLFGAINDKGEVVIPFEKRRLYGFLYNLCKTSENGNFGAINTKNETILPLEYSKLVIYKTFIILRKGNKMAFADHLGRLQCQLEYDQIKPNIYGGLILTKNNKDFFFEDDGKIAVNGLLGRILWYGHGTVWSTNEKGISIVNNGKHTSAFIPDGQVIHTASIHDPIGVHYNDSVKYFDIEGQQIGGVYSYIGMPSAKPYSAYRFKNGKCIVNQNGKWGMIDRTNKILIPFEYDWLVQSSTLDVLVAKRDNQYGLIDTANTIILKFRDRKLRGFNYQNQLDEAIAYESQFDSLFPQIKINESDAVKIAKNRGMYYEGDHEFFYPDHLLLQEEGNIYWEISSSKQGYTNKGDCARTNGCSIFYSKIIKIDAISGKVLDKKSTKKLYHNYE